MKKYIKFVLLFFVCSFCFSQEKMLPLLEQAEKSGITVYWDTLASSGMLEKNGHQISFRPDSQIVMLDSKKIELTDAPVYENGTLKVKANEDIAYATLFDGNEYIEINKGIKIAPGAYEVTVTSTSGVSLTKVVNVNIPVIGSVEEHSILPMISMFISITTLYSLSKLKL